MQRKGTSRRHSEGGRTDARKDLIRRKTMATAARRVGSTATRCDDEAAAATTRQARRRGGLRRRLGDRHDGDGESPAWWRRGGEEIISKGVVNRSDGVLAKINV
ncbi:hypothetical protein LINPERPRIM_LOCUS17743 [Linum perenne]